VTFGFFVFFGFTLCFFVFGKHRSPNPLYCFLKVKITTSTTQTCPARNQKTLGKTKKNKETKAHTKKGIKNPSKNPKKQKKQSSRRNVCGQMHTNVGGKTFLLELCFFCFFWFLLANFTGKL
jgi:hypothetical protein